MNSGPPCREQNRLENSLLLLLDKQERLIRRQKWDALPALYQDIAAVLSRWSAIPAEARNPSHPDLIKAVDSLQHLHAEIGESLVGLSQDRHRLGLARVRLRGIRSGASKRPPGSRLTVQA